MPLALINKSLLVQERPGGDTATLDLDAIFSNHRGSFLLGGAHFSHTATNVRLRGAVLYASLALSTKRDGKTQTRDAAIDLEVCGVVRADGLCAPAALIDPALNTVNTHAVRVALVDGRRTRLAISSTGKTDLTNPWAEVNLLEALTLHFLAKAERTLLRSTHSVDDLLCSLPRLLPGLLEGDKRKLAVDAAVDPRTGFVRNYLRYYREAPSVRPRDWASIFEAAWSIVDELLRSTRARGAVGGYYGSIPLEVHAYLVEAERHLSRSLRLRRQAVKLDREDRRQKRRMRFGKRLEVVAEMLARATLPPTPPPSPGSFNRQQGEGVARDPFADAY